MNTFRTSDGQRLSKGIIDRNCRKAKENKLRQFKNDHGFFHCQDCGTSQGRIDCSHTISVNEAQNTGRVELAWDVKNITLRCANCHRKHDSLTNVEREYIFKNKQQ